MTGVQTCALPICDAACVAHDRPSQGITSLGPEFNALAESMIADDPGERPTASEALASVQAIRSRATSEALDGPVPIGRTRSPPHQPGRYASPILLHIPFKMKNNQRSISQG